MVLDDVDDTLVRGAPVFSGADKCLAGDLSEFALEYRFRVALFGPEVSLILMDFRDSV